MKSFRGVSNEPRGKVRVECPLTTLGGREHQLVKRLTVQVLHRQPVGVPVATQLEHLCHVRMRNPGGHTGLIQEHPDERVVASKMTVNPLDGDPLPEPARSVQMCQVNPGHAAHPDLPNDGVPGQAGRCAVLGPRGIVSSSGAGQ
jgi:hypothetical protein